MARAKKCTRHETGENEAKFFHLARLAEARLASCRWLANF
jgi:hypothetical protein